MDFFFLIEHFGIQILRFFPLKDFKNCKSWRTGNILNFDIYNYSFKNLSNVIRQYAKF